MRTGFSKVYTRNLARSLVRHLAAHAHLFEAEAAAGGRREQGWCILGG